MMGDLSVNIGATREREKGGGVEGEEKRRVSSVVHLPLPNFFHLLVVKALCRVDTSPHEAEANDIESKLLHLLHLVVRLCVGLKIPRGGLPGPVRAVEDECTACGVIEVGRCSGRLDLRRLVLALWAKD